MCTSGSHTVCNVDRKHNVVTFNKTAARTLNDFYENSRRGNDVESQKRLLIETAVALIRSDITDTCRSYSKEFYPDPQDIRSIDKMLLFIPKTPRTFVDELFVGTSKGLKMATIGQCLLQVARPRSVMAPLQIG